MGLPAVHQWAAVVAITVALVGAGVAEQRGLGPDISLAGLAYTVTATLMDAIMYVFTEHALEPPAGRGAEGVTPHRGPDPAELCTLVGLFNFPVAAFYVVTVVAHGRWDDYVAEPIAHNGCGGTQMLALGLWVAQSGVYFGHYMSFYYTVGGSSSVAAGVNKAVQVSHDLERALTMPRQFTPFSSSSNSFSCRSSSSCTAAAAAAAACRCRLLRQHRLTAAAATA